MRNSKHKALLISIFGILLLVGLIALYWWQRGDALLVQPPTDYKSVEEVTPNNEESSLSEADFAWRFTDAETENLDGNPQTNIFLTATYTDGTNEEILVDTVDGGCSELEGEGYEGDISDTGRVQCYYAGLGQRYRITEAQEEYVVERKLFEEALPDTTPPDYEWEVIATIPASV